MIAYEIQITSVESGAGKPFVATGNNIAEIMQQLGMASSRLENERLAPDEITFRRVPLFEANQCRGLDEGLI